VLDIYNASPKEHYEEFRRLHKKKVECLEAADPEYLAHMWYYPLYNSKDLFLRQYADHNERVRLLERLRDDAIQFARGFEQGEFDVQTMTSFAFTR
jgi:hypothetical protein